MITRVQVKMRVLEPVEQDACPHCGQNPPCWCMEMPSTNYLYDNILEPGPNVSKWAPSLIVDGILNALLLECVVALVCLALYWLWS